MSQSTKAHTEEAACNSSPLPETMILEGPGINYIPPTYAMDDDADDDQSQMRKTSEKASQESKVEHIDAQATEETKSETKDNEITTKLNAVIFPILTLERLTTSPDEYNQYTFIVNNKVKIRARNISALQSRLNILRLQRLIEKKQKRT